MDLNIYNKDWDVYSKYIEKKIKGKCVLTNKNWKKLRDFHFEGFIKQVENPYMFLFKMIYINNMAKEIPCIYRFFYKEKKKREKEECSFRLKTRAAAYRRYR